MTEFQIHVKDGDPFETLWMPGYKDGCILLRKKADAVIEKVGGKDSNGDWAALAINENVVENTYKLLLDREQNDIADEVLENWVGNSLKFLSAMSAAFDLAFKLIEKQEKTIDSLQEALALLKVGGND